MKLRKDYKLMLGADKIKALEDKVKLLEGENKKLREQLKVANRILLDEFLNEKYPINK